VDAATRQALVGGSAALGLFLDETTVSRFANYLDLLLTWNRRIKLTSVVEPEEVVARHFLDSLAVVPALEDAHTLVDVGSGAGFPGIPVALARPGLPVTLVESIRKKAAFLEALKRELALPNVVVQTTRMEDLVEQDRRFDAAVSRATFAPREWVQRGTPLVAAGGRLIAMVVPGPGTTIDGLAPGWQEAYSEAALLPPYAPGRALLVLRGRRFT
jgi:16S rRNA (guanine527-N7)-methyltransferase